MQITLNGKTHELAPGNVSDLLALLELKPAQVAVERNRTIVPRSLFGDTALAEGDEIEIVHFIGGG